MSVTVVNSPDFNINRATLCIVMIYIGDKDTGDSQGTGDKENMRFVTTHMQLLD